MTDIGQIGAGIQLTPNCTKILEYWGILKEVEKIAAEPTHLAVRRYSGPVLALDNEFNQKIREKYETPFLCAHRVDLQLVLYHKAKLLGVQFRLGQRVESLDTEDCSVTTLTGLKLKGDLIIAADGLWSKCREFFLKKSEPPLPTGDLAYRVVLELDQIKDPDLRDWIEKPAVRFWVGPGAHAVAYSLRAGKMYNIVLLVPDDLPDGVSRQPGSVDQMKALFKDWDPILCKFLDAVNSVEKWKLMHSKAP
jgi:salicylate hydroxylase